MVAVPITVLAIIVSLYTDVFKELSNGNRETCDYFKIKTYYKDFEEQKQAQIKDDKIPYESLIYEKDTETKYCHLLFIDRTLSTLNYQSENSLSGLINYIGTTLSSKTDKFLDKPKNETLKNMIFHYFLQNLLIDDALPQNAEKFHVCFFDGKSCNPHNFSQIPGSKYHTDYILDYEKEKNENEIRKHLGNLLNTKLYKKEYNQKSDFKILFKTIDETCKWKEFENKKIIVTIISDFDHDFDEINEKHWNRIINTCINRKIDTLNDFRQYNLIVFPSKEAGKVRAKKLLDVLKNHIANNDNIVNISLDDFCNNNLDNFDKENFKNRIKASFYSIRNSNAKTVIFYYPKENSLGLKIAEANIKCNDFQGWRIVSENTLDEVNKTFDYFIHTQRKNGKINGDFINNTGNSDSINIRIRYNPKNDTEQYRMEVVTNEGRIISYPIEFKEYMQGSLPDFGRWLLNILCICIVLIVFSCVLLLYRFVYMNKDDLYRRGSNPQPIRFWTVLLELLIFIGVYALLLCCCVGKYTWLGITTVSIIICMLLILLLIGIIIKKRWT